MSYYSRFFPFLKPYLPRMAAAIVLVGTAAALNLVLLRLAGRLWDVITIQRDVQGMTALVWIFLGLMTAQGLLSMGHSYLVAWVPFHWACKRRN